MSEGYIKLWRKVLKSPIFTSESLLKVWIYCLCKMYIPPRDKKGNFMYVNKWIPIITGKAKTEVEIKPGQFLFGRHKTAKKLRMKSSSVRNRTEKLKKLRKVDIQTYPHYSIITVNKWEEYQGIDKEKRTGKGQAKDRQRTGKGHKQEYKELKESKEKKWVKHNPPTILEIKTYFTERGLIVDADFFYKYFTEGEWVDINGNKVYSWKQKALTWNERELKKNKETEEPKRRPGR